MLLKLNSPYDEARNSQQNEQQQNTSRYPEEDGQEVWRGKRHVRMKRFVLVRGLLLDWSCSLTALLLQNNFGHCSEDSPLWYAVGHVEIKTTWHRQHVHWRLVLPAADQLLLVPEHLHRDVGVPVPASRLADVGKLHERLVLARYGDEPGHGGRGPHTQRPVGGRQQGRGRRLGADPVNDGL